MYRKPDQPGRSDRPMMRRHNGVSRFSRAFVASLRSLVVVLGVGAVVGCNGDMQASQAAITVPSGTTTSSDRPSPAPASSVWLPTIPYPPVVARRGVLPSCGFSKLEADAAGRAAQTCFLSAQRNGLAAEMIVDDRRPAGGQVSIIRTLPNRDIEIYIAIQPAGTGVIWQSRTCKSAVTTAQAAGISDGRWTFDAVSFLGCTTWVSL